MRIHLDKFAYDLEQPRDPRTQLLLKWRFRIYALSPVEHLIDEGEADTREEAEKKARRKIARLTSVPSAA